MLASRGDILTALDESSALGSIPLLLLLLLAEGPFRIAIVQIMIAIRGAMINTYPVQGRHNGLRFLPTQIKGL